MYKKKIAIICDYILIPERIGGMDRFYLLFDKKLKELNYEVDWYVTYYNKFHFYDNLTITSANGNSVEQKFIEDSTNRNYDIIVTHFTQLCTHYYKQYKNLHKKAFVLAVDHNSRPINGFTFQKIIKNYLRSFLNGKYIDKFIAVSDYSKNHLINDFSFLIKSKIQVVLNGVSNEGFIFKKNYSGVTKFIIASHISKEKGIQDIIFAVSNLPDNLKQEIKIDVFGEGNYEPELKKIIDDLDLQQQFTFKGSVTDLEKRYAKYDYLLHASYGETYCYSVVESLVAKLPVITTNSAGNVLKLVKNQENGFLFDAGNLEALSSIIQNIMLYKNIITKESFFKTMIPDMSLERMVNEHIKVLVCI
jgi:glycosyltransferase involved in cell wall biosynthesis